MKHTGILLTAAIVLTGITLWNSHAQTKSTVSDYRQWTQVNPKPLMMPSWVSAMCAQTPKLMAMSENDPHEGKFFVVYVNSIGKNAMLKQPKPEFPIGTVIVKEKLPTSQHSRTDTAEWKGKVPYPKPELLTVMQKREKGYYPRGGDWEYSVMDGTGQKTLKSGKLEACALCHSRYTGTDWVTRSYLPEKVVRTLYPKTMPKRR